MLPPFAGATCARGAGATREPRYWRLWVEQAEANCEECLVAPLRDNFEQMSFPLPFPLLGPGVPTGRGKGTLHGKGRGARRCRRRSGVAPGARSSRTSSSTSPSPGSSARCCPSSASSTCRTPAPWTMARSRLAKVASRLGSFRIPS